MGGNELGRAAELTENDRVHFLRDGWLPMVTPEAVSKAMDGFPLPLQSGHDVTWLSTAVRRALAITIRRHSVGPDRKSNVQTRDELRKIASRASELWRDIFECSMEADEAILDFACRTWDGDGGMSDSTCIGPPDYRDFRDLIPRLHWLAGYLQAVASDIPSQKGPWKASERREIRIERAQFLSPIFEQAFGSEPTVNTWPGSDGGPWPDFYQRMVALAFNEKSTPDLEGVLDEARRRHLKDKVIFEPGIIPNLHP